MESKYANLEKGAPRPRRASRGCIMILLVYIAVLLTGIVITLPLLVWYQHGNLFGTNDNFLGYAKGFQNVPEDDFVERSMSYYDMKVGGMSEVVGVDTESQVEVITSSYQGAQVTTYLNFKQSLGAFYISEWDECYMIGGLDHRLIKPEQLVKFLGDTKDHELHTSTETVIYEVAEDYPITDRSLLPRDLAGKCENKDLYWLRQLYAESSDGDYEYRNKRAASKEKRSVKICLGLCITIGRRGPQ